MWDSFTQWWYSRPIWGWDWPPMVILGMVQLFLDLWIITWSILGSPQNLHVIFCRFYGYFPFIAKKLPKGLFPYVLPIQWGWWPCHTNFSYSTLTLAIQLVAIQGLWDDREKMMGIVGQKIPRQSVKSPGDVSIYTVVVLVVSKRECHVPDSILPRWSSC